MANISRRKINPSSERSDEEICSTAGHQIPANSELSDDTEVLWYDHQTGQSPRANEQSDESEVMTADSDAPTAQPGHYEGAVCKELAWKGCEWFDDMSEVGTSNVESPSSRSKRSIASLSKHINGRLKFQRHRSSSLVCSFQADDSESSLDGSSRTSSIAPRRTLPTLIPICLPPGCIPEEVTVQVPGSATRSTSEARSFIIVDMQLELDSQQELDPWMSDICEQALSIGNTDQPCLFPSPVSPASIVVHDVEEDVSLENKIISNYVLKMFLQNQRVVYRRNAICEELEMNTGFVKINGAKFSLWHLRAELQNTSNICKL